MPLARRYRANQIFEKRRLRGKWFTDTLDGRVTSKEGDWYGQVFANRGYFATVYPMDTKSKAGDALHNNNIALHVIEPERHNQNPYEGVIREVQRKLFRIMVRSRVPRKF